MQVSSSSLGQPIPDARSLPGQPVQPQTPSFQGNQALPSTSQSYQGSGQTYPPTSHNPHQSYQPSQSPGQPPFQSARSAFPGYPSGYPHQGQVNVPQTDKQYQMDGLPSTAPFPSALGVDGSRPTQQVSPGHLAGSGQQPQQIMPPSSVPHSPGMIGSNQQVQQYPYQNNYYSSPPTPTMPGNRPVPDSQGNMPYPTSSVSMPQGYGQQTNDGRPVTYPPSVPPQTPQQWIPPFAHAGPPGHVSSPYQYGSQPVSYPPEQSINRQPQSQTPQSSYYPGSYTSGPGYSMPGQQQPVSSSRQPYVQPPSQAYRPGYPQPGVADPRAAQCSPHRSASSASKISSIDMLLCHAEELEPRVLNFSGRRGKLLFIRVWALV